MVHLPVSAGPEKMKTQIFFLFFYFIFFFFFFFFGGGGVFTGYLSFKIILNVFERVSMFYARKCHNETKVCKGGKTGRSTVS